MPRVNVYLPDELLATVRATIPDLNLSGALQAALRDRLSCRHDVIACAACAERIDRRALIDARMSAFYVDLLDGIQRLVDHAGTAEGAGRVARDVGQSHQISAAIRYHALPRPKSRNRGHRSEQPLAFDQQERSA